MPEVITVETKKAGDAPLCFGNFEVLRDEKGNPFLLGAGSFGRTYKARHRFLDNVVALKAINERYAADATARRRFLIEGRAVKKLSHPNIARLDDFGEADGVLYYAMEYCAGGNLSAYVQSHGAMEVPKAVEVAQQILGSLKVAHAAGFVHRDIKPSNIMLLGKGGPLISKLIDFGLVHASGPTDGSAVSENCETEDAHFLGTPLFASPEQLLEQELDGRSDLFSLGITLWYLVAGGAPESGSSATIAASRLGEESYESRLPNALPVPFRAFLAKMIEKDAEVRFKTASEAFDALNKCAIALGLPVARDTGSNSFAGFVDDPEATLEEGRMEVVAQALAEIVTVESALDAEYKLVTRGSEVLTGINYAGEPAGDPENLALLHVLHPPLFQDHALLDLVRVHVAKIMALGVPEVIAPVSMRDYTDYMAIVLEHSLGGDLLSELRARGIVRLPEARGFLEKIATACDRVVAAGLPGVELAAGRILIERTEEGEGLASFSPKLHSRYLAVREAPALVRLIEAEPGATMTTAQFTDPGWEDDMRGQFATLIYRIVAGRNCPKAASTSLRGYVAAAALSEQSNRLLAQAICLRSEATSCGQILRELLNAEGVLGASVAVPTPGSTAGSSAGDVAGSAGSKGTRADRGARSLPKGLPRTNMPRPQEDTAEPKGSTGTRIVPLPVPAPTVVKQQPPSFVAAPAKPRNFGKMIGIAAAVIAVLVVAVVLMNRPPKPGGSEGTDPVGNPTQGAAALALRFVADLPEHTVFTVAGESLKATRAGKGSEWSLAVAGDQVVLPMDVAIAAKGYTFTPQKITISTAEAAAGLQSVGVARNTGTIHFVNKGASDYSEAAFRMLSPLKDELNFVELDRADYGAIFAKTPDASQTVPTGTYQILLTGNPATVATRRANLDVLAGKTIDYEVPASIARQYFGNVTLPGERDGAARQVERLVKISPELDGGMVIDRDGGVKASYPIKGGRLDADGVYTATVQFSAPTSGGVANKAYNQTMTIRPRDVISEFSFRETPDVNAAVESHLNRVPKDKDAPVVALLREATAQDLVDMNKVAEPAPTATTTPPPPAPDTTGGTKANTKTNNSSTTQTKPKSSGGGSTSRNSGGGGSKNTSSGGSRTTTTYTRPAPAPAPRVQPAPVYRQPANSGSSRPKGTSMGNTPGG